jgi:predicted O-linked N-acetylglucosamine transferase (SPINDLY family)
MSTRNDSFTQALQRFQASDLNSSRRILEGILAVDPHDFDALHLLGVISAVGGENGKAEMLYKKALRMDGTHAELRMNLTLALVATGKFDEALTHIEHAVGLHPRHAPAHVTRGNILRELRRREEAVTSYEQALAIDPGHARAWCNLGLTLGDLERYDEALASQDKALEIDPRSVAAWTNRGIALTALRRHEEALASYDRALAIDAGSAEAWSNRSNVLSEMKRYAQALASVEKALDINPGSAEFWSNRGSILAELHRYDGALESFDKAVGIDPEDAQAWYSRGLACYELARYSEAVASFARALAKAPDTEYCLGDWVYTRMMVCDWDGIENDFQRLAARVDEGRKAAQPLSFLAVPSSSEQQKRCAENYVRSNFASAVQPLYAGEKHSHDRIRVAYLSADFHDHATAFLMAGLFEAHDRTRFETFAVSFGPDTASAMRARLRASFDRFIDVRNRSDRETALLLREAETDIAVDLKGYTRDSRPGILAYRPAPVQISYLGYPGTLGADFIDYIIADRDVIPEAQRTNYTEKVIYLPDSYQVNDAARHSVVRTRSRAEWNLPEAGFVFCCFNNSYKIAPAMFAVWMRLLERTEGSVLWLLESSTTAAQNLRHEARSRGVAPERLVFAPRTDHEEHLARYTLADLFLDTLPYNAHTTASDALWAGLPVLTCVGNAFPGRVGSSLLRAIGLLELITESLGEYEARALELAADSSRLAALRDTLVRNRRAFPLFDTALFARRLESAYVSAWKRQQSGLSPDHIDVVG